MPPDTIPVRGGFDSHGMRVDYLGRRQPTRFNMANLLGAIPGALAEFKREVPPDFLAPDMIDDKVVTVVACPCGEEPAPAEGGMAECGCGRFYLNTGQKVLVALTPESDEAKS